MEQKYFQSDKLQDFINWGVLEKLPRYAGGHDEQMMQLFKDSEVIGHWNEGDYQGMVATCVKLKNGWYVIYNDYYGSCSGCDAWEDCSDIEFKNLVLNLSNGAYIFNNIDDVLDFLQNEEKKSYKWDCGAASGLLSKIKFAKTT